MLPGNGITVSKQRRVSTSMVVATSILTLHAPTRMKTVRWSQKTKRIAVAYTKKKALSARVPILNASVQSSTTIQRLYFLRSGQIKVTAEDTMDWTSLLLAREHWSGSLPQNAMDMKNAGMEQMKQIVASVQSRLSLLVSYFLLTVHVILYQIPSFFHQLFNPKSVFCWFLFFPLDRQILCKKTKN